MKNLLLLFSTSALIWSATVWAQTPGSQPPSALVQGQSQTWSGSLADAACKEKNPSDKCAVSGTTAAYGITASDGTFYKFDDNGNSLVTKELERAGTKSGSPSASVVGKAEGNTIKVESFQIR